MTPFDFVSNEAPLMDERWKEKRKRREREERLCS
jgi:hypothetical protein